MRTHNELAAAWTLSSLALFRPIPKKRHKKNKTFVQAYKWV